MRDQVLEILEGIRDDVDFENEKALVSKNVLESFDIIRLISSLSETFDIEISAKEITAVNFDSLDAITALVEKIAEEDEE